MYKQTMIDMKKIPVILILFLVITAAAGCKKEPVVTESTTSDYVYHSSVVGTTLPEEESATGESMPDTATTEPVTTPSDVTVVFPESTAPVTGVYPSATQPAVSVPVSSAPQQIVTTTTQPPAITDPPTTSAPQVPVGQTEVDLSISMPAANGKMKVYKTPSNKYIDKVSSSRGIDASRLCAVVSVPETGQNYVFEFSSDTRRSTGDLKKVYLLDSDLNILSIASSDSSQRVNLTSTENWFCMNVLIKGVIFPAIKDQF